MFHENETRPLPRGADGTLQLSPTCPTGSSVLKVLQGFRGQGQTDRHSTRAGLGLFEGAELPFPEAGVVLVENTQRCSVEIVCAVYLNRSLSYSNLPT